MTRPLRSLLATLAGLIAGALVVGGVEALGHLAFPPPPGLDPSDPEALAAAMRQMPVGALLAVLAAWFAGAVAGFWVAVRLHPSRDRWPGVIVVALLLVAAGLTMLQIPHPVWFIGAAFVTYGLATAVAFRLAPPTREMMLSGRR